MRKFPLLALALLLSVWTLHDCMVRRALLADQPHPVPGPLGLFVAAPMAEQAYLAGKMPEAERLARIAIAAHPGEVSAIRTLALVEEGQGNGRATRQLMNAGARWSWRDTPTQVWLFAHLAQAGQFDEAAWHGAALVARNELPRLVVPALASFATDPASAKALTHLLKDDGAWKPAFYQGLQWVPAERYPALAEMFLTMGREGFAPKSRELAPMLSAMISSGMGPEARNLWGKLYVSRQSSLPAVIDPDFSKASPGSDPGDAGSPFEWRFNRSAVMEIATDPEVRGRRGLHIAYAGSADQELASQQLALPQGNWRLSFSVKSVKPDLETRLRIGVRCAGNGNWLTLPIPRSGQSGAWSDVALPFSVPASCVSQSITVESIGAAPGEDLDIWIANLAVDPQ